MDASAPPLPGALLEREHEVERIREVLQAVDRGSGGVLVVEGAAGMGKSRLLEAAHVRAAGLGIRVLAARATELEQGFPFGVVRQLFERALLEADPDERDRWLATCSPKSCPLPPSEAVSLAACAQLSPERR